MTIELKALFGNLKIEVENTNTVPKNATLLKVLDNFFVYNNDKFIFFNEKVTNKKYKVKKNVADYISITELF